jgi:hypothetical protein
MRATTGAHTVTNEDALSAAITYLDLAHGDDNEEVNEVIATLASMLEAIRTTG